MSTSQCQSSLSPDARCSWRQARRGRLPGHGRAVRGGCRRRYSHSVGDSMVRRRLQGVDDWRADSVAPWLRWPMGGALESMVLPCPTHPGLGALSAQRKLSALPVPQPGSGSSRAAAAAGAVQQQQSYELLQGREAAGVAGIAATLAAAPATVSGWRAGRLWRSRGGGCSAAAASTGAVLQRPGAVGLRKGSSCCCGSCSPHGADAALAGAA